MTRDEIDALFLAAVKQSIRTDENQRYIFARLLVEMCADDVEVLGREGYGSLAIAAALRRGVEE